MEWYYYNCDHSGPCQRPSRGPSEPTLGTSAALTDHARCVLNVISTAAGAKRQTEAARVALWRATRMTKRPGSFIKLHHHLLGFTWATQINLRPQR